MFQYKFIDKSQWMVGICLQTTYCLIGPGLDKWYSHWADENPKGRQATWRDT